MKRKPKPKGGIVTLKDWHGAMRKLFPPTRARSAKSGRFVSLRYATRHPKTTVVETVKP